VRGICVCLEKPEVEIYRKWICIICVNEMSGSMLGLMPEVVQQAKIPLLTLITVRVFTCVSYAEARNSYRLDVCLSVRPSVTRWYGIKTAEHIVMLSSPHDSPFILVLCVSRYSRNSEWWMFLKHNFGRAAHSSVVYTMWPSKQTAVSLTAIINASENAAEYLTEWKQRLINQ